MRNLTTILLASLLTTSVTACELDVPDLNDPGLDSLEKNPTPSLVLSACTGLVIGNRRNTAQPNGYVAQIGIVGREAYNFDQADPRFVLELLESQLNPGSPFGGNFWAGPYANIRLANIIQRAVVKVPEFDGAPQKVILGFSKTIEAADLLEVINARDTNGAVIDTDKDIGELGAVVDKTAVFAEIGRLLDEAATDLAVDDAAVPCNLSSGYPNFTNPDKPVTSASLLKLNRALRARVAAYTKDYATLKTALDASFLDITTPTLAKLDIGVYHTYSTGPGDTTNGLLNANIFAHPSIKADAQMNGATPDARLTRKVTTVAAGKEGSAQGLTSNLKFTMYPAPDSPVPIIRNEELILLRAEQQFFGTPSDVAGALATLNIVRQTSGSLNPLAGTPTPAQFTDALLYERRYSLLFEGGHRLFDVRRFDKMTAMCGTTPCIPLDKAESVRNVRYPIPLAECNARPGEARCMLGSQ